MIRVFLIIAVIVVLSTFAENWVGKSASWFNVGTIIRGSTAFKAAGGERTIRPSALTETPLLSDIHDENDGGSEFE